MAGDTPRLLQREFDGMMEAGGLGALPKDGIQYEEMRRAFFGGARVVYCLLLGPGTIEDRTAIMEAILAECDDFAAGLLEGRF